MRTRADPASATAGETARGRPAGGVVASRTGTPLRPRWRRRVATSRARAWLVRTPDAPPAGGWAILTVAHGVVREYEDGRQLHQRRQPDSRPRVVAEDEERRPEHAKLRERHTVDDRRHRVLADPEMQILAVRRLGLKVSRALVGQRGLVRWPEVCRSTQEPRDVLREHVEHFAGRVPAG